MTVTTLRSAADLAAAGLVAEAQLARLAEVGASYAIALPQPVAALIDASDAADPIGRQYVPSAEELIALPGESADPIGDAPHSPVTGLVHRYPDRVLIKAASTCRSIAASVSGAKRSDPTRAKRSQKPILTPSSLISPNTRKSSKSSLRAETP